MSVPVLPAPSEVYPHRKGRRTICSPRDQTLGRALQEKLARGPAKSWSHLWWLCVVAKGKSCRCSTHWAAQDLLRAVNLP